MLPVLMQTFTGRKIRKFFNEGVNFCISTLLNLTCCKSPFHFGFHSLPEKLSPQQLSPQHIYYDTRF